MGLSGSKSKKGAVAVKLNPLLAETQIFALWTLKDVRDLWKIFRTQIYGFSIVEVQFESIMTFNKAVSDHVPLDELFKILDNDNDGRIDGLELLGGLALVCQGKFEDKARLCFELFDFNLNASLAKKELVMMMMSTVCGLNLLSGGDEDVEPDLESFETLAHDAFLRADRDGSGNITYDEFVSWARSNREMMTGLESLNKLALNAKVMVQSDDSAPEAESEGDLSDAEESNRHGIIIDKTNNKSDSKHSSTTTSTTSNGITDSLKNASQGDQFTAVMQWHGQIHEPSNFNMPKKVVEGPDTNLELKWAYGVHTRNSRNNIRYITTDNDNYNAPNLIVYPTAALGVIYDIEKRQQHFFQGHSAQITSLAVHPSGHIVATGDLKSIIHIWDALTYNCISTIKGMTKCGIQLLVFSPSGDRIATVGSDPDHTVTIYDFATGSLLSSAKGLVSPNNVFDLAYSGSGNEIVIVGKNQIKFYRGVSTDRRALDSVFGHIGSKGKKQSFLCVTYYGDDAIVGCASGELYRFKAEKCVQIIQAHAVKEPVLSIYYNAREGTLVSGAKDGVIKTWDSTLKEVGAPLDMSEDLDGDGRPDSGSLISAVISVQILGHKILIGTKGGDIFEATMSLSANEHHVLTRIAWGHSTGELWGLAVHPTRDEFVTSGDDKTVRIWSLRSHEQVNMRTIPNPSRAVTYSNLGDLLCLGMEDGSMAVMETATLRVLQTWTHTNKPITDVKFSPDGNFIVAGCKDTNIYIYRSEDKKSFLRQAVCRGHSGAITHLDFSANSQFIQSNGTDYALLFWDVKGNQVKASTSMRDVVWHSLTCTLGWPVQGIWSKSADGTDVNACHAVPNIEAIVSGDDNHLVHLHRYPSLSNGSLHQTYIGHASHVTCVRFSSSRRHVLSIGGDDRTILQWTHELEVHESSSDGEGEGELSSHSIASLTDGEQQQPPHTSSTRRQEMDLLRGQVPMVRERSMLQEAANRQQSAQELSELIKKSLSLHDPSHGDQFMAVRPWTSSVVEPTDWRTKLPEHHDLHGSTDVDFTLEWVHGYRSQDTRNNLRYTSSGDIVYCAASLCIVYCKKTGKQRFIQGAHSDDVLSLAAHPSGQIFATGEAGKDPCIVVWNSEVMQTLVRLEGAHKRGIPLLAFNDKGNLLASIGLDPDSTLVVHEWAKNQKLFSVPTDKGKVLCLSFICPVDIRLAGTGTGGAGTGGAGTTTETSPLDVVVTGGEKHLKFWWAQGQNVKSQKALWSLNQKETHSVFNKHSPSLRESSPSKAETPFRSSEKRDNHDTVLCVASASPGVCVSGMLNGDLVVWKDFKRIGKSDTTGKTNRSAHPPIQTLWACKGSTDDNVPFHSSARYISGDKAGNVIIWKMSSSGKCDDFILLIPLIKRDIDISSTFSIRSVCTRDGYLLVGTQGSEIFEVEYDVDESKERDETDETVEYGSMSRLAVGHNGTIGSSGEVWGLAVHPTTGLFITTGDDCTARCWTLEGDHRMLSYIQLDLPSRACDISPDGSHVAIAMNDGHVEIYAMQMFLDPNIILPNNIISTKKVLFEFHAGSVWSQVVKYSFEGSILAVGSHDMKIYLYDCKNYSHMRTCEGHTSFVTHIDFGVNAAAVIANKPPGDITQQDIVFQSCSGAYELLFWQANGDRLLSASTLRDTHWETFTSPFGWPVQGIWPADTDGSDINAVCRSHTYDEVPVVATADEFGRIRLFNYPCLVAGAADKCYRGHSSHVTNIKFSYNDAYCISTGGEDHCILVWATDILEERRARRVLIGSSSSAKRNISAAAVDQPASENKFDDDGLHDDDFDDKLPMKNPLNGGDERQAVQAWKGAIREPSGWVDPPGLGDIPNADLQLKFVYGYRGWDCRNNIGFGDDVFESIYHIAGVGIVFNSETHSQIHNTEHDDDILCLAVHPEGHTVATGEIGPNPKIVLWDTNTGVTHRVILFHKKGVSSVAFSGTGALLVSIGMDVDRTIAVHNVKSGAIVGSGKAGKGIEVYALAVHQDSGFVTGGKNHIKFWDMPSGTGGRVELSAKGGIYGKGVQSKTVICITYLGTEPVTGMSDGSIILWSARSSTKVEKAHDSAVTSMCNMSITRNTTTGGSNASSGPRIITGGKDGIVHIWNYQLQKMWSFDLKLSTPSSLGHQIQAVVTKDDKLLLGTKAGEIYEVSLLSNELRRLVEGHFEERGELWGLAVHPSKLRFVTGGDDMMIRVWDGKVCSQLYFTSVGSKVRSLAYSSDGSQIAAGTYDGQLKILSDDLQSIVKDIPLVNRNIQVLTYSPNGELLAVGAHNDFIYLLDTKTYSTNVTLKGHSSFILQLDFSADNSRLQSTCGAHELLFWDTVTGKQVTSATSMRDIRWATFTSTLGWPVQGMWPPLADGLDINAADRSPDGTLLVTGDDFRRVKLFKYPCPKEKSKFKEYKGHSEHVPCVRFSRDGSKVYSVGGIDKAILQFEVKMPKK